MVLETQASPFLSGWTLDSDEDSAGFCVIVFRGAPLKPMFTVMSFLAAFLGDIFYIFFLFSILLVM